MCSATLPLPIGEGKNHFLPVSERLTRSSKDIFCASSYSSVDEFLSTEEENLFYLRVGIEDSAERP